MQNMTSSLRYADRPTGIRVIGKVEGKRLTEALTTSMTASAISSITHCCGNT